MLESWRPQGHYAAPVTCVVVAIALYGLRLLRTWRPLRLPAGLMISRAIVLLLLVWMAFPIAHVLATPVNLEPWHGMLLAQQLDRARLQAQLERTPGQHLVIVRNRVSAGGGQDWIYNEPDIDHAKVVWARDMGEERNQELLRYFAARRVWCVDQNDGIMRLEAYQEHTPEQILAAAGGPAQGGHKN